MKKEMVYHKMLTTQTPLPEIPWNIYPRPMLKRDSFLCLNGEWSFRVVEKDGQTLYDGKITVPFAPESVLSSIDKVFTESSTRIYETNFALSPNFQKDRVILHFGAVDQYAKVYINDIEVCSHTGGYTPFCVDITERLKVENILRVEVQDHLSSLILPYGKQTAKRGGMWYTPVSGIWQTVWLESVHRDYVKELTYEVDGNRVKILSKGVDKADICVQMIDGKLNATMENGVAEITIPSPRLWSPEDPYLYHYTLKYKDDEVSSYFAIRTLTIQPVKGIKRLCLNGKPVFLHALLDQGYWSDGLFTPHSPEMITEELEKVKKLGFNTLRKHIKIEPQFFYSECDRLGIIVMQDMINNGKYSFLRDTALPTIGLIRKNDKRLHKNEKTRQAFISTMTETVKILKNHPSICYWTIFNEGWGQFDSDNAYNLLKSLDSTRFIDSTSGWFINKLSDVDSRHVYFRKVKLSPKDKPLVLSEFGGYAYAVKDHVFNTQKVYGYGKCTSREEYVERVRNLYLDEIIPLIEKGLCGAVYTQVSDIEDEINGIFTYDRAIDKLLPEEFIDISEKVKKT